MSVFSAFAARRRALAGLSAALLLSAGVALPAHAETVLRVSAIPDEAPTELQRKFAPLGKYLEKELGMKVSFVPVSDYAAVVESLATKKLDLAWLGGGTRKRKTEKKEKIKTKQIRIRIGRQIKCKSK